MKKSILFIISCLVAIIANAQDIEFSIGEKPRVFFEHTLIKQNSVTFSYAEISKENAMLKIFHEQKWWEAPVYLHLEYQTTFEQHTALLGGTYSLLLPCGAINFSAFARYDTPCFFSPQVSLSYSLFCKNVEFYGYNHCWYSNGVCFFGEERIHYNFNEHYAVGAILSIAYFGSFTLTPSLGFRFRF